ncbi:MAG: hypothetical protein ACYTBZ_07025 [Planctomycetota bacterium]|jgi:hypothetical protein
MALFRTQREIGISASPQRLVITWNRGFTRINADKNLKWVRFVITWNRGFTLMDADKSLWFGFVLYFSRKVAKGILGSFGAENS